MNLKILIPHKVFATRDVEKIVAEAQNGSFCLLPRHIDFTAALVPGILALSSRDNEEFIAVDEGILVKCGPDVLISARSAAQGADLGLLERTIRDQFKALDERERKSRTALVGLEVAFIRKFLEQREPQP